MKTKLFILVGIMLCGSLSAQNTISTLKKFRDNADMAYYVQVTLNNIEKCHKAQCEKWNVSQDTNRPPHLDLSGAKAVPMLAIQFVNMDSFDWEQSNIYDHIIIDSLRVFTFACIDERMNVHAFANYFDGEYAYADLASVRPDDRESIRGVIKNINAQQPEMVLYSHSLRRNNDLNGFMYLKGDSIYVYRVKEGDTYELNNYIGQFFSDSELRGIETTSTPFIYQHYNKEAAKSKAGNTPKNRRAIKD